MKRCFFASVWVIWNGWCGLLYMSTVHCSVYLNKSYKDYINGEVAGMGHFTIGYLSYMTICTRFHILALFTTDSFSIHLFTFLSESDLFVV